MVRTEGYAPSTASGEEVVVSFLNEDPEAIGLVSDWVRCVVAHRAWGFESPEDLVQSALLGLTENFRKGRYSGGPLRAYVSRVAKNLCVDSLRRQRVRGVSVPIHDEDALACEADSGESAERTALLFRVLDRLDGESQRVLCLAYFQGMSRREIGEILGISEDAAKMRLSRCLKRARAISGSGPGGAP